MPDFPYYEDHPIAACWPLLDETELAGVAASIKVLGLLEPLTMFEGKILDGRNRYRACKLAGVIPHTLEFGGTDPIAFAHSKNEHRRHSTTSQRAMTAAKLSSLKTEKISQSEAAEQLKVSRRSVVDAAKVLDEGTPELVAAVESGEVPVSVAATVATLPEEEQREAVATGTVAETAKKVKEKREQEPNLCDRCKKTGAARDCRWCAELEAEAKAERGVDPRTLPPVIVPVNPDAEGITSAEAGGGHPFLDLITDTKLLAARYTRDIKKDGEDCLRLYQYLMWCGLLDHDPAKDGQASFLPLRGVVKIVELAGSGGKMKTEAFIKNAYLVASGGKKAWIPPQTARTRAQKGGKK